MQAVEIDRRPDRHDAARVERAMALVVVPLDVTGIECRPGDQVEAGATLVVVGQSSERQPEVDSTMAST